MGTSKKKVSHVSDEDLSEDDVMGNLSEEFSDYEAESDSGSEEEAVKLPEPSKNAVYNRDALLDKLQDISWPENLEWIHKLTVDFEQGQEVDVNDDLTRELAFYTQALEGTRQAFESLQELGLPFLRPPDYYAEMVKSDTHMIKVKGRLLAEKKQIEEAEERRKARDSKRLSKEVQSQKLKERAKQKKDDIESVKKWRKQRQQSGFDGGDKGGELDFEFGVGKPFEKSTKKRPGVGPGDRSGGKGRHGGGMGNKKNGREFKNTKFGFGGRKGMQKQNTSETTNSFKGFSKDGPAGNKRRKK